MSSDDDVPPAYRDLVRLYGAPIGVEEARSRWGELTAAAEAGQVTLITRERWEWAALVPIGEVVDRLGDLPVWPLVTARAKLGDLVRAAAAYPPVPQALTRHRRPAAALLAARILEHRPQPSQRKPAAALLQEGHRIVLEYDPGQSGRIDEYGDVVDEPIEACFVATARDHDGSEVAVGTGDTIAEALLGLTEPYKPMSTTDAEDGSDEPPF